MVRRKRVEPSLGGWYDRMARRHILSREEFHECDDDVDVYHVGSYDSRRGRRRCVFRFWREIHTLDSMAGNSTGSRSGHMHKL